MFSLLLVYVATVATRELVIYAFIPVLTDIVYDALYIDYINKTIAVLSSHHTYVSSVAFVLAE